MMKKKPPLDHPYVVAYEEWLALKTQVKDYLEFLFYPFPSCYWHYFLLIEFFLICRFAFTLPWTKITKVEADWWYELKYDLLYVTFVVELLLFSLCFWAPGQINLFFFGTWVVAVLGVWGIFEGAVREYWRLRYEVVFYFFCYLGWPFSCLFWGGVFFIAYFLVKAFFFNSLVLFSVLFFFFRLIDFITYRWMGAYWPLFNDVDAGVYFNLFDSYGLYSGLAESNPTPLHSSLFVPGGDLCSLPGTALVYDPLHDSSLHDMPGVEGNWGADSVEERDKEPDERRLWYVRIWEKHLYSFRQEIPFDWDLDPRYRGVSTLAWAHSEELRLFYNREVLKLNYRDRLPLKLPERLVLDYDWSYNLNSCPWENYPVYELDVNLRSQPISISRELGSPNVSVSDQIWFWSDFVTWAVTPDVQGPYLGIKKNFDDICMIPTSFCYWLDTAAVPERAYNTQTFIHAFQLDLNLYQKHGFIYSYLIAPSYPWYYRYGSVLDLRQTEIANKVLPAHWTPQNNLTSSIYPEVGNHSARDLRLKKFLFSLSNPPHGSALSIWEDASKIWFSQGNWVGEKQAVDEIDGDFIELIDAGLQQEALLFGGARYCLNPTTALFFTAVDEGSFAFFYLHTGVSFMYEDFMFRVDRLDTVGFIGFILSYDMGIVRWRSLFFYLRAMRLSLKWGQIFFAPSYFFPNLTDFFLLWGNHIKRPPKL